MRCSSRARSSSRSPRSPVPIAWERFDPDLQLTDENTGAAVTELLAGLVELAHQHQLVAA